jgi:hypothetical protein
MLVKTYLIVLIVLGLLIENADSETMSDIQGIDIF